MRLDPRTPKRTFVRIAQIVALYTGSSVALFSPEISGIVIGRFPTENIRNPE